MKFRINILTRHRTLVVWYLALVFLCFIGVYFLAGPWYLVQFCEDGLHFFDTESCGPGIRPLIVSMNAETLDIRVESLMPPLTYTKGVGYHLLGTDALGRDIFAGILYGGQRSLLIGFVAGGTAMALGWFLGLWSVFVRWTRRSISFYWAGLVVFVLLALLTRNYVFFLFPVGMVIFRFWIRKRSTVATTDGVSPWLWGRWFEWYQALPDLLLILVLSAAIGVGNIWGLTAIIIAVLWPSMALISRRVAAEVSVQPYFRQALRNRVSGIHLIFHYLWGNTRAVFRAMFPLVVARVILLESTISFLGMGLPSDIVTIGSMVSSARHNLSAWWMIVFSCLFIFLLVYPLLLLGMDTRRQRIL